MLSSLLSIPKTYLLVCFPVCVALSAQNNDGSQKISGEQLKDLYKSFVAEYPIASIEDPFDQDDWEHYSLMTSEIGEKVQIVGDDLLVTNPKVETSPLSLFCLSFLLFLRAC